MSPSEPIDIDIDIERPGLWTSARAGWAARRGPLRPRDVPGVIPWLLAIGAVGAVHPTRAAVLAGATLVIWSVGRAVVAIRGGLRAELMKGATRAGEALGTLSTGAADRRAFADMDDFNARWDHAVSGVWVWWIALLAAPLFACWP